jgi:hypothetical protein
MAKNFRKRLGKLETWHFHPRCPNWPFAEYVEQTERPPNDELCLICLILEESEPDPDKYF